MTIRWHRLAGGSYGTENIPSARPTRPGFVGRKEVLMVPLAFFRFPDNLKRGGPPPIEGIGGGPSARVITYPCMTTMLGVA